MKTEQEIMDEIVDRLNICMIRTNKWIYYNELIYRVLVEFRDKQITKRIATRLQELMETLGLHNVLVHYSKPYKSGFLSDMTYIDIWGGDSGIEYNDRIHVNIFNEMKDLHGYEMQINGQKQYIVIIKDIIESSEIGLRAYAMRYISYLEAKERMETTLELFGSFANTVNLECEYV